MRKGLLSRGSVTLALFGASWAVPGALRAQGMKDYIPPEIDIKRDSGQTIQPVFEGWQRYPDGHISMWFGYLNRNFQEQIDVPVGPMNTVDFTPSGDSGQPTHFYPRRQKYLFKVDVPPTFDPQKRVTWTLVTQGQKLAANGWLQAEWEIDDPLKMENNGGAPDANNRPPEITGSGPQKIKLGEPLTLAASATDDGLPKPTPQLPRSKTSTTPVTAAGGGPRPRGVTIRWIMFRNPPEGGQAQFAPAGTGAPVYGKPVQSSTSVTFTAPGTYWLRAVASDTTLETPHDVMVTVSPK